MAIIRPAVALVLGVLAAGLLPGCRGQIDLADVAPTEPTGVVDPNGLAEMEGEVASGFSWVIDGQLAGMARPGSQQALEDDLDYLERKGVKLLVSLTETPTSAEDLEPHGIALLHEPVEDFTAPTQDQLWNVVHAIRDHLAVQRRVTVHCAGGMGRTGTFLAAYFVYQGMTADEAIAEIRRLRPGSIETPEQEAAVHEFAASQPNDELPTQEKD